MLSSTELRDRLLEEPALVSQFQLIRSANRVLFGVGDVGKDSTVRASGLASPATIDGYVRRGGRRRVVAVSSTAKAVLCPATSTAA